LRVVKNVSLISLALALAFAGWALASVRASHAALSLKAQEQEQALAAFVQWRADYDQLLPVARQWTEKLPSIVQARDLYSLYRLLGAQLSTNADTLVVERAERLQFGGQDLGAHRVCFASLGQGGLLFEGSDFDQLYEGLEALARRPDVQMRAAVFTLHEQTPRVAVQDFCLILRDAEPGETPS
jgi:hypothetical protein